MSTKLISTLCFDLNKKTYKIIVQYLKAHKEQKGEKQIDYQDLWPDMIEDSQVRSEIQTLPIKIMKVLNKDLSQAYNLLMESVSDPSLRKLIRYDRIRDLYQFVTEIILKKKEKPKKEKQEKKQVVKQIVAKRIVQKIDSNVEKKVSSTKIQWTSKQERYLCAIYLERSLLKCCQKMISKFGESQKWSTAKKVYKKAEDLFEKSLRNILRSNQCKQIYESFKISKQNLISQILKRKSNSIQAIVLKYYRAKDLKKKETITKIFSQISNIMEATEYSSLDDRSDEKEKSVETKDQLIKIQAVSSQQKITTLQSDVVKIEKTQETQETQKTQERNRQEQED